MKRHLLCVRRGARDRQGDGEDRIRAQNRQVGAAVESSHGRVQLPLVKHITALEQRCDPSVDMPNGASYAQAFKFVWVAVPKFHGFMNPGRRPRGHRGAASNSVDKLDVGFDGGATTRVENLPPVDSLDVGVLVQRDDAAVVNSRRGSAGGDKRIRSAKQRTAGGSRSTR